MKLQARSSILFLQSRLVQGLRILYRLMPLRRAPWQLIKDSLKKSPGIGSRRRLKQMPQRAVTNIRLLMGRRQKNLLWRRVRGLTLLLTIQRRTYRHRTISLWLDQASLLWVMRRRKTARH
ncbi:hypothetical protein AD950_08450 [Gluconobacter oxydans]|nr:hypothetical protein AD950_08450 [Gluconobacter oxydans]